MRNISTFRLALWSGLLAEVIACCSIVFYLGYASSVSSHSGLATQLYILAFMFQLPGMWLANRFMPFEILFVPFVVLIATALFAIVFWVVISLWRKLHGRNRAAEVPKDGIEQRIGRISS